jgi:two-component system sensor histidine kinase BarA
MMFPKGIRFQLLLLGLLPASILAFCLTFWFIQTGINNLDKALSERGEIITENLAPASIYGIFSGNDELLQRLTDNVAKGTDVVEVAIYNKQGQRRAFSKNSLYNKAELGKNTGKSSDMLSHFRSPIKLSILKKERDDPISLPLENSKESSLTIGEVRVTLSRLRTIESQSEIIYTSFLLTLSGLLLSLLLAYRLSLRISKPILALTNTVKQVSKGDLTVRSNIQALEELNELKLGLNIMAESLEKNQLQLQSKVKAATLELEQSLQTLRIKNNQLDNARKEAEQSSQQKSLFLAHMSHEIRTPMNGIIGFLRLLGNSPLTPIQSNQLQLIETSAKNLLVIIDEILDHAELESGNLKLTYSSFDLRRSIEESIVLLAPLAHQKDLKLILLMDEACPKNLDSDPIRLRQVLFNLIGNAIKFSASSQIIIRVSVQNSHGRSLLFSVSDSGRGISKHDQRNLFSPFSQAEIAEPFPPPGTGLGLNIAQNIIHALGGKIGLSSKESVGSTFWFTLPLTAALQTPPRSSSDSHHRQAKKILLLDNNKLSSRSLQQQLFSVGLVAITTRYKALENLTIEEANKYSHLIINTDNIQYLDGLSSSVETLNTIIACYIPTAGAASFNLKPYLLLPCTQTSLLEVLSNENNKLSPLPDEANETIKNSTSQAKLKILVADDIEINRLLLIEQIKPNWDAVITEADDGEKALELLKGQTFDLAFIDLRMPKRSGLSTVTSLMQTTEALNQDIPFIAITAYLPDNSRDELTAAGFSAIMIKPIEESCLISTVNKLLDLPSTTRPYQSKEQLNNPIAGESTLFESLLRKVNGNQEVAYSLIKKLECELPKLSQHADHAFKEGQLNSAIESIHKIHGSACYFEMSELSGLAKQLEEALNQSDLKKTTELLHSLKMEIARFVGLCHKT